MQAERPTSDREELRLLYQVTASDLTFFKSQQWSVTNYALLLLAGIVGLANMLKPLTTLDRSLLAAATLVVAAAALVVLTKLQTSIGVRQSRLEAIRSKFSDSFHFAWAAEDKGEDLVHHMHLLRVAVIGGAVAISWVVGIRLPGA
jgi:hypothetical protein